jgi:hypothetical protein
MRCQLLGQLEHVLGRPFSYVVLPRPDTLGVVDGTRRGWFLLSRQWGMVTMSFWPYKKAKHKFHDPYR